jgi:5-methylcytosine-specific restriction endonuclease McrA
VSLLPLKPGPKREPHCKKCGLLKTGENGRRCSPCTNKRNRTRYASDESFRTHTLKYNAKWGAAHPDVIQRRNKGWQARNPEKYAAAIARWQREHPTQRREAVRRYHQKNPAERSKHRRNYEARRLSAEGDYTQADWDAIVDRQGGRCIDCRVSAKLTVGHLIPLSRGGSNHPSNIAGQCKSCNCKQGTRIHPLAA